MYRSDFLLNILPASAASTQISVKHAMMSLAWPLVVGPALISLGTNYWPLHGYWSHFSLSPLLDFRKASTVLDFEPLLALTLSEQSEFSAGEHWALSVRDCWISFFHQTEDKSLSTVTSSFCTSEAHFYFLSTFLDRTLSVNFPWSGMEVPVHVQNNFTQ